MKNFKILLLITLLLVSVSGLSALDSETNLYFQAGTLTDDSFKFNTFWAIAGFNLNWQLGEMLMITPECFFVIQDLKFNSVQLAPALIANLKIGNFFIGAGPTKWFKLGSDSISSDLMLKVNVGLTKYRMIYTLFGVIDFSNDTVNSMIGIKLGFNL